MCCVSVRVLTVNRRQVACGVSPDVIAYLFHIKSFLLPLQKALREFNQFVFSVLTLLAILIFFAGIDQGMFALALEGESFKQQGAGKLTLDTANGPHEFNVEIMRTVEEREKGLMFRKYLPANRGMLFDFQSEQPIAMWMKNTYIPLDMIFISRRGKVTSIYENAEPFSENIISSNGPVYAVLEVNGGIAAKIGLKIGDHVNNPLFEP